MKVLVAMDSFKGSLSASEACDAVSAGLRRAGQNIEINIKPVADGGEGTAAAMIEDLNGEWASHEVMGPLPDMRVDAPYAWFAGDRTALIEMSAASGLMLVPKGKENPLETTTYGTGQLIAAAVRRGARKILLAVGGSATVDGGVGAAQALGWEFFDSLGRPVGLGGAALGQIAEIAAPAEINLPPIETLCDVNNPLTGRHGAAHVYGPQKGATPDMVAELDAGLVNLAAVVREQLGIEIETIPGTGASGGLSAGARVFMNANLMPGAEAVLGAIGLGRCLAEADWVVTGEGKFDRQSLCGKVVSGVSDLAIRNGTRVAVLAGKVEVDEFLWRESGIEYVLSLCGPEDDPEFAMEHARECLERAAESLGRMIDASR